MCIIYNMYYIYEAKYMNNFQCRLCGTLKLRFVRHNLFIYVYVVIYIPIAFNIKIQQY